MNIRDTLQSIRYDLDAGDIEDVKSSLGTLDGLLDDLGKLKTECIDNPERAFAFVVELCDAYGIVVTR